jgi:hypothetical protein
LFPVSRASKHNPQRRYPSGKISGHSEGCVDTKTRVVIELVETSGPVVNYLVTRKLEVLGKILAELEPGVVRGDVNAHGFSL